MLLAVTSSIARSELMQLSEDAGIETSLIQTQLRIDGIPAMALNYPEASGLNASGDTSNEKDLTVFYINKDDNIERRNWMEWQFNRSDVNFKRVQALNFDSDATNPRCPGISSKKWMEKTMENVTCDMSKVEKHADNFTKFMQCRSICMDDDEDTHAPHWHDPDNTIHFLSSFGRWGVHVNTFKYLADLNREKKAPSHAVVVDDDVRFLTPDWREELNKAIDQLNEEDPQWDMLKVAHGSADEENDFKGVCDEAQWEWNKPDKYRFVRYDGWSNQTEAPFETSMLAVNPASAEKIHDAYLVTFHRIRSGHPVSSLCLKSLGVHRNSSKPAAVPTPVKDKSPQNARLYATSTTNDTKLNSAAPGRYYAYNADAASLVSACMGLTKLYALCPRLAIEDKKVLAQTIAAQKVSSHHS